MKSILIRTQLASLAILTGTFAFVIPASAQTAVTPDLICTLGGGNCLAQNTLRSGSVQEFIGSIIQFALPIIIIIGVAALLFGAFQFITGKAEEGRKTIFNSIIGIAVALLAVTLVSFVVGLIQGLR